MLVSILEGAYEYGDTNLMSETTLHSPSAPFTEAGSLNQTQSSLMWLASPLLTLSPSSQAEIVVRAPQSPGFYVDF